MSAILDCLYLVAGACALPFWLWKLPKAERYRAGIAERLGLGPQMPRDRRRAWIHCASVGEAGIPKKLVAGLRERHPDWQIVFSTNTNTGAARLAALYPGQPVFYMPLDLSWCVKGALDRVSPDVVILVELEFWPNFAEACRRRAIPMAIINGRIQAGSRRLLGGLRRLQPTLWDAVRIGCARSADDARGFVEAGLPPERVVDCGLLKCDLLSSPPPLERLQELRRLFGISPLESILVAGSTHPGEEAILAAVYRDLKRHHRRLRLIVAPRHVERAAEVLAVFRTRGLPVAAKTALESGAASSAADAVVVVDTIGDLMACYGLATCAFVGRSLVPPGGGQNVMEPAALGKPVLTGPYTANFCPEMSLMKASGGAQVVDGRAELARALNRLLTDPEAAERMGRAGREIVRGSQGATERTLAQLEPLFASPARLA